jgi:phosphoribosylformylglycinamidine synthase
VSVAAARPLVAVPVFPGSNDDRDAAAALERVGARAARVWHDETELPAETAAVVLPGGFSFGDYLRCGAIASLSPVMAAVRRFAAEGGPVLGVCNGFQMLCEAGLLPGVLRGNHHGRFNCLEPELVIERSSPWTGNRAPGEELRIPIKHGEGAWYVPDAEAERLAANGQVLLRYRENPNGATAAVAGVCNEAGNVFGLMPHPEHAVDALLGSTDGALLLGSLVDAARLSAAAIV